MALPHTPRRRRRRAPAQEAGQEQRGADGPRRGCRHLDARRRGAEGPAPAARYGARPPARDRSWAVWSGSSCSARSVGAAAGAAAGAVAHRLRSVGIDDDVVERIREELRPGTSALLVLSSDADVEQAPAAAGPHREATLIHAELSEDAPAELRELARGDLRFRSAATPRGGQYSATGTVGRAPERAGRAAEGATAWDRARTGSGTTTYRRRSRSTASRRARYVERAAAGCVLRRRADARRSAPSSRPPAAGRPPRPPAWSERAGRPGSRSTGSRSTTSTSSQRASSLPPDRTVRAWLSTTPTGCRPRPIELLRRHLDRRPPTRARLLLLGRRDLGLRPGVARAGPSGPGPARGRPPVRRRRGRGTRAGPAPRRSTPGTSSASSTRATAGPRRSCSPSNTLRASGYRGPARAGHPGGADRRHPVDDRLPGRRGVRRLPGRTPAGAAGDLPASRW